MNKDTATKFIEDIVRPETVALLAISKHGEGYEYRHVLLDESGKYIIGVNCAVKSAREYLAATDWESEPIPIPEHRSLSDSMAFIERCFNTGKTE